MTFLGFIILLVVAAIVGACGELIAGAKVPGGWLGSIMAGLIGAWLGGLIVHVGPVFQGIQVVPAIVGAAVFVLLLRIMTHAPKPLR